MDGPIAADFKHVEVMPRFTDKALEYLKSQKGSEQPFFLYLAYASPHVPVVPSEKWRGKSGLNLYGDFVMMMDSEVGRILQTLEELGMRENTIVIFTADNGCCPTTGATVMEAKGHYASGDFRGYKADLFEGGHRVPCIVQWPSGVKKGICRQTISLNDFFRTFADLTEQKLKDNEGEDSVSLLPLFRNPDRKEALREATIHHSIDGQFAIRQGDWKLLASPSSGGWSAPRPQQKELLKKLPPMQLYHLGDDPQEKNNLIAQHPKKAQELLLLLLKQIEDGRSTPGAVQNNDATDNWKQKDKLYELKIIENF